MDDRVAGGDAERAGHAGTGLAEAGVQGVGLGGVPEAGHVLAEAGQPADATTRAGDERAASRDPLQQTLGDQRVHRLPDGHPGDSELLHQLALGRCRGAGLGVAHEGAYVLAHLYVFQGAA